MNAGTAQEIDPRMAMRQISELLPRFAYRHATERQLHEGLAEVLTNAGVPFEREYIADEASRFDFFCWNSIVIEAKVGGSAAEVIRQVNRYARLDIVRGVIIVATRQWTHGLGPIQLEGKWVYPVSVRGQWV